jgi:hypothetical protein
MLPLPHSMLYIYEQTKQIAWRPPWPNGASQGQPRLAPARLGKAAKHPQRRLPPPNLQTCSFPQASPTQLDSNELHPGDS